MKLVTKDDITIVEDRATAISVSAFGVRLLMDKLNPSKTLYYSNRVGWLDHPNPHSEFVTSIRRFLGISYTERT